MSEIFDAIVRPYFHAGKFDHRRLSELLAELDAEFRVRSIKICHYQNNMYRLCIKLKYRHNFSIYVSRDCNVKLFGNGFTHLRKLYHLRGIVDCSGGTIKYLYKNRKLVKDATYEYLIIDATNYKQRPNYLALAQKDKILIINDNDYNNIPAHPNIFVKLYEFSDKCTVVPQAKKYYCKEYQIKKALSINPKHLIITDCSEWSKYDVSCLYECNVKKITLDCWFRKEIIEKLLNNTNIRELRCQGWNIKDKIDISSHTHLLYFLYGLSRCEEYDEICNRNRRLIEYAVKSARNV